VYCAENILTKVQNFWSSIGCDMNFFTRRLEFFTMSVHPSPQKAPPILKPQKWTFAVNFFGLIPQNLPTRFLSFDRKDLRYESFSTAQQKRLRKKYQLAYIQTNKLASFHFLSSWAKEKPPCWVHASF